MAEKLTFNRGFYIDKEILMMAKRLAYLKKTSINAVVREAIVKMYYEEMSKYKGLDRFMKL